MFEQPDALPEIPRDVLIAIRDKRLEELERLRAVGMHKAERLDKAIRGKLTAADVKLLVGRRQGTREDLPGGAPDHGAGIRDHGAVGSTRP